MLPSLGIGVVHKSVCGHYLLAAELVQFLEKGLQIACDEGIGRVQNVARAELEALIDNLSTRDGVESIDAEESECCWVNSQEQCGHYCSLRSLNSLLLKKKVN